MSIQTPTPDQSAAHQFLSELRTRITTQPLPYQYGVEARALESAWEVFGQAREAMKKNPGCKEFAASATDMLNMQLRPFTAKWHRAYVEGRLDSTDGGNEFREDLAVVQAALREFAKDMQAMAYGQPVFEDRLTPAAISESELDECFKPMYFGIPLAFAFPSVQESPLIVPGKRRRTLDGINSAEKDEVVKRREALNISHHPPSDVNAVGLGLSGGGIRSASFSLGIVQVLAQYGLINEVDFLSTVSGGGYTGAFLTRRLGGNLRENDPAGIAHEGIAHPHGPDPDAIRYVRFHAEYLSPLNLKEGWVMAMATLVGMFLNWSAPLFIIILAALAAVFIEPVLTTTFWKVGFGIAAILLILASLQYCVSIRHSKAGAVRGIPLAFITAITLIMIAAWAVQAGYNVIPQWTKIVFWPVSATLAALVTSAPAIIRFIPVFKKPAVRRNVLQGALTAAGLLMPLIALAVFYACCYLGNISPVNVYTYSVDGRYFLAMFACICGLISVWLLDINSTGPHRLYRDRLSKTFIQAGENSLPTMPLEEVNPSMKAPYHLINATLNLPNSEQPGLHDRKCDFFLFSKHWCGSPVVDYFSTQEWKASGDNVDLATAMAVSGAAFSSYMGLESRPTLIALLTFLNIRLGFWIKHPRRKNKQATPGFLCLLREMTGTWMSEKQAWLNLSDGGHIENMGCYELLRRRCKYIICVDGEADPNYTFQGLMTLVRHAQIDFGIRIEPNLDQLRADLKTKLTKSHSHFCRIYYPPLAGGDTPEIGLLLYLKLSVTGNEPELIKRYRINHPDFPHQSTLDQFFGQEQFEAYRQLGVHVAEGLFARALIGGGKAPETIEDWFRRLAANLLEPQNLHTKNNPS